jgi:hypothetical protein
MSNYPDWVNAFKEKGPSVQKVGNVAPISAACIRASISAEHTNVQTSAENSAKNRNSSRRGVLISTFSARILEPTPFLALIFAQKYAK